MPTRVDLVASPPRSRPGSPGEPRQADAGASVDQERLQGRVLLAQSLLLALQWPESRSLS